jgi:hypothetical protein
MLGGSMKHATWRSARIVVVVALACAGCASLLHLDDVGYGELDGGGDGGGGDALPPVADASGDAAQGDADAGAVDAFVPPDAALGALPREILADKPVAYFPLDEDAGATSVIDHVAGVRGELFGTPGLGVPGVSGNSVTFPNTKTDYIGVLSGYDFVGGASFTLELWAHPRVPTTAQVVFAAAGKSNGKNGYVIFFNPSDAGVSAELGVGDPNVAVLSGGHIATIPYGGGLETSDWIHLVGTFDGNQARLFLNGTPFDPATLPADGGRPTGTPEPFKIGSAFLGEIDEVALYDKVLPLARIVAHFKAR